MEHFVRVRTDSAMDGFTSQPDIIKDIDWHNSSDRKWLMNHLHWAMMNGRTVSLYNTPRNCTPIREATRES